MAYSPLLQRVNQIAGIHAGGRFIKFNLGAGDIAARAIPHPPARSRR